MPAPSISPNEDEAAKFTSVILATTENSWVSSSAKMGATYEKPRQNLEKAPAQNPHRLRHRQSVTGPFDRPADSTVYIISPPMMI
ncbi:neutral zinc metallopeptidase [Shigella flexneri]